MKLLHGTTDCIHIDALSLIAASSCLNLGMELSSSMFMVQLVLPVSIYI